MDYDTLSNAYLIFLNETVVEVSVLTETCFECITRLQVTDYVKVATEALVKVV